MNESEHEIFFDKDLWFPTPIFKFTLPYEVATKILDEVLEKHSEIYRNSIINRDDATQDYGTDYGHNIQIECFEKIVESIKNFFHEMNMNFEMKEYWNVFYDSSTFHTAHGHNKNVFDIFNYSGILYLSNFGETEFYAPFTNVRETRHIERSEFGKIIMFPSTIIHSVPCHNNVKQTRRVIAFNGMLYESI